MGYPEPAMKRALALSPLLVSLAACSSAPSTVDPESRSSTAALSAATPSTASLPGDAADTSCQIVLRHTYIDFESSLGPETNCSSGTCWAVITVTFDVAMND